jgi:hypothetical protein
MKFASSILIAISLACATPSPRDAGWQLLGTGQVSNVVDYDVIVVNPPRKLRSLKLLVVGSPVRIQSIRVELSEGETLDVSVGAVVPAGDEGPVIAIPAGLAVERVVFRYEVSTLFGSPASVALYGME